MDAAERATVRIVGEPGATPAAGVPSPEPEAQPPVVAAPLDGNEPTPAIGGGPAFDPPTADAMAEAAGGGIADRMRARFAAIASTEEFPVPGWELEDGSPGLIVVARAFSDRKAFATGVSNEVYIAKSTHALVFVNDDGSRDEIPGGWGPALASIIGANVSRASDLVGLVISKPDPDDPERRIPNVTGIGTLAADIVNWAGRGTRDAEEALGE